MANPLTPNDSELNIIAQGNPYLVEVLRDLFDQAGTLTPDSLDEILIDAGNAQESANQANSSIDRLSQALELLALAQPVIPPTKQDDLTPPLVPVILRDDLSPSHVPSIKEDDLLPPVIPPLLPVIQTFTPVIADAATGGNVATTGAITGLSIAVNGFCTVFIKINNINKAGLTGTNLIFIRDLPQTGSSISVGSCVLDKFTISGLQVSPLMPGLVNYLTLRVTRTGSTDFDMTVATINGTASDIASLTITYPI